jgi:ribosome-associated protein
MTRKTPPPPLPPATAQADPDLAEEGGYLKPSKSQKKREMLALQVLGVALVELPKDALKRMPMPESLDDAVRAARRITDHEGRRRQLQYIGRVMRSLTEDEAGALQTALDTYRAGSAAETAQLHALERWRERLLADDNALTEFARLHPGIDVQQGHTLIRNTRREIAGQKPPRYFRALFKWLKQIEEGRDRPEDDDATGTEEEDDDDF